jgi:hypothetical protein
MRAVVASLFFLLPLPIAVAQVPVPLLDVTVSSGTQSIYPGASRVSVLTLHLKNGCETPAELEAITIRHKGLGSRQDIERLYALTGTRRITSGAPMQQAGMAVLRFRGFRIEPCDEKTITVAADFSEESAIAAQHWFYLLNTDVLLRTPGTVTMRVSGAGPTSTAAGDTASFITVTELDLPVPLRYGTQRTLARIRLEASGRRNQVIHAITFTNGGSARGGDLQNFSLQTSNGTILSDTVPSMDDQSVTLRLRAPYVLEPRDTVQWYLKGDVRASRKRTVRLTIEEPGDIETTLHSR